MKKQCNKIVIRKDIINRIDNSICANCDKILYGNLRLTCCCGRNFCSQECLNDYHEET